jgi:hypothetical protein
VDRRVAQPGPVLRRSPSPVSPASGTFDDDGDTITGRGAYSRDGGSWTDDLALTYRRR